MALVNIYEAKTRLSELLRRARKGENITIAQAGVPIVRLVPISKAQQRSRLGVDEGAFEVPDDFNEPLLEEELSSTFDRVATATVRSQRRRRKPKPPGERKPSGAGSKAPK